MRALVLAAWGAMTLAALAFVLHFGRNCPWNDEWEFVPVLTGDEPAGPVWLWSQHNEHRFPLPRLLYLWLVGGTQDFRAGSLAQVAMVSLAAWLALRAAGRTRGPRWTDAAIPAALLHWEHAETLLMGYGVNFALYVLLTTAVVVRCTRGASPVGTAALLLPTALAGGPGVVFAPVAAGGLLLAARPGRERFAVAALTALLALFCGAYLAGREPVPGHPPPAWDRPGVAASAALQALAMAFGPAAGFVWPLAGGGLFAAAGWLTVAAWRRDRYEIVGALVAALAVMAAVGVGRGGFGPAAGLWPRYGWLGWPALLACLLADGRRLRTLAAVAVLVALPGNVVGGARFGAGLSAYLDAFTADAASGMTPGELVERHLRASGQEERALAGVPMLRRAEWGPFGSE